MPQYEMTLRDYGRILRRRYKIVVLSVVLVALFSLLFMWLRRPLYQSTATVKYERSVPIVIMPGGAVSWRPGTGIETQPAIIMGSPIMREVARRLDEQGVIKTIAELQRMISVRQRGETNILDITVTGTDREEVQEIANLTAQAYQQDNEEENARQARETRQFIEQRLGDFEDSLRVAEQRLRTYKEQYGVPAIDVEVRQVLSNLSRLEDEQLQAESELRSIQTQLSLLRKREKAAGEAYEHTFTETLRGYAWETALPMASTGEEKRAGTSSVTGYTSPYYASIARLNAALLDLQTQKDNLLLYFKPEHPRIKDLEAKIQALLRQVIEIYEERTSYLTGKLADLSEQMRPQRTRANALPQNQLMFARLQRAVDVKEQVVSLLTTKYQEALIQEWGAAREVTIVQEADLPDRAINMYPSRALGVGAAVGLVLGLLLAFVFESLDTSIGTIEDVEDYLGVLVLSVVPYVDPEAQTKRLGALDPQYAQDPHLDAHARLIAQFDPRSVAAESYRTLRTNIQYAGVDQVVKSVLITSASLQEGKSVTCANLALTMAQEGKQVLLVGCNLRRPTLYRMFGLERSPGVTDIVLGRMRWNEVVKDVSDVLMGCLRLEDIMKVPGFDNLHIITCGDVPPNPLEMLNSSRMDAFLEEAKERYDMVLMDSPPVLPVSDAAILARKVDGVVLVYEVGRTPGNALGRAKANLDGVQARILGTVLNGVKAEITGFSPDTQYYIRYYGEEGAEVPGVEPKLSWWDRIRGRKRRRRAVRPEEPTATAPEDHGTRH